MWILLRYTLAGKNTVKLITDIVVVHEDKPGLPYICFRSKRDAMKHARDHVAPSTFYHPVEVVQD